MTYTIGEAAKIFGIAPSAIRYYDSLGILPNTERKGGIRVFDESGMNRLRLIECYKLSGMNMREIKSLCAMIDEKRDVEKRREIFYKKHDEVLELIRELQETEKILKFKCWLYDNAVELGFQDTSKVLEMLEMPPEIAEGAALLKVKHSKEI